MKHSTPLYCRWSMWIGDTAMAHSLFQAIKQAHPDSALDVLHLIGHALSAKPYAGSGR
ncbi:MAG: hypothetical protein ACNYPI_08035 [Arenicellales bacterium WSBS_2016_MAG_OTU3]